jgi:dihydrodipicolinate synthase/N-acetylneuraminate lyase
MSTNRPRGVIAATATPLQADGTPDLQRLVMHCRTLLESGCDGINLLGTTGEATAFSVDQRLAVMRAVVDAGLGNAGADGFAGCISATTNLTGPYAQTAWSNQGTEAGATAVRKASELRAIIARFPLVGSVKAALAAVYHDPAWARVALPLRPLNAEQASLLNASMAERTARA